MSTRKVNLTPDEQKLILDYRLEKGVLTNDLHKAAIDQLEKGGEGSKGGKVIGHTAAGKPKYASDLKKHLGKVEDKMYDHLDKHGDDVSNPHEEHLSHIATKYTKHEPGDFGGETGVRDLVRAIPKEHHEAALNEVKKHLAKHKD
jgi:hypothetical protein